jgi:hypothetical protein
MLVDFLASHIGDPTKGLPCKVDGFGTKYHGKSRWFWYQMHSTKRFSKSRKLYTFKGFGRVIFVLTKSNDFHGVQGVAGSNPVAPTRKSG